MAYYQETNIDEWITSRILMRYQANDIYDVNDAFKPDYRNLFAEIGDVALFTKGEVYRANLWYELASIDWWELNEEIDEELDAETRKSKKEIKWWDNLRSIAGTLISLSNEGIFHRQVIIDFNIIDTYDDFKEKLKAYLDAWASYEVGAESRCGEIIAKAAITLISQVEKDIKSSEYSEDDEKRLGRKF